MEDINLTQNLTQTNSNPRTTGQPQSLANPSGLTTKILPLILNYKKFHDTIHGYIEVSNYACRIIDSKYFQQLRKKKQLGTCYFVYPNAVHTRFEHSIGTYNYASRLMNCILNKTKNSYISEYLSSIKYLQNYFTRKYNSKPKLDTYICELVKIAALCHDLGHGPFSHIFDDNFLPSVYEDTNKIKNITHEERSCALLELIIKKDEILSKIIHDDEIDFMKHLIDPEECDIGFLFQIVSNYLNGLDVDKFDYLNRDSYVIGFKMSFDVSRMVDDIEIVNNIICYPEQAVIEIYKMFNLRYNLHKQVYSHKSVIASQFMIVEFMKLINPYLKLSDSINNLDKFIEMSDEYVLSFAKFYKETFEDNNIKQACEILERLENHDSYVYIDSILSNYKIEIPKEQLFDFLKKELKKNNVVNDMLNDIIIFNTKIGFVSGNKKNPFDNIYCYSTKSLLDKEIPDVKKIDISKVSLLIPTTYQEYITMIFYKNRSNKKNISKLTELILKFKQELIK